MVLSTQNGGLKITFSVDRHTQTEDVFGWGHRDTRTHRHTHGRKPSKYLYPKKLHCFFAHHIVSLALGRDGGHLFVSSLGLG